jgi:hypothetical protein
MHVYHECAHSYMHTCVRVPRICIVHTEGTYENVHDIYVCTCMLDAYVMQRGNRFLEKRIVVFCLHVLECIHHSSPVEIAGWHTGGFQYPVFCGVVFFVILILFLFFALGAPLRPMIENFISKRFHPFPRQTKQACTKITTKTIQRLGLS